MTKLESNKTVSAEINYKKKKHYKTNKYPIRQPKYLTWLIWLLSKIMLKGKQHKVEKINMEGLKPPYILLSNHMAFIDFELVSVGTYPHRMNNVVNIDGYYKRPWLLEWIGSIATRKFTQDIHLIKSIKKVLERGDVLCMYPEARYSPAGTTSYLPDTLGNLIKKNKVPVVVAIHRGNHLYAPAWNFRQKRKVPFHTTIRQLFTIDDVQQLTADEINLKLREAFVYDDYQYQKDNKILIKESYRAEGLHKILYQCPNCNTEHRMNSSGIELFCDACGKRWEWKEDGFIEAKEGKTEFDHIPDWHEWERQNVKKQILEGTYLFEDEVEVYSQPHCWKFHPLGKAILRHDANNGFVLEGNYRNSDYKIQRMPLENLGLHVEYDFQHIKPLDCIDISTNNDSFYCYPSKKNVVTKLALATEEIFKLKYNNLKSK